MGGGALLSLAELSQRASFLVYGGRVDKLNLARVKFPGIFVMLWTPRKPVSKPACNCCNFIATVNWSIREAIQVAQSFVGGWPAEIFLQLCSVFLALSRSDRVSPPLAETSRSGAREGRPLTTTLFLPSGGLLQRPVLLRW